MSSFIRRLGLLFLIVMATSGEAAIHRVGNGAGCTHATIQAAIDHAIQAADEDHEIRLLVTEYHVAGLDIEHPPGAFALIGGYASCLASAPTPGQRSVLIGDGVQSVLRIRDVRSLQLSNLDIHGGHGLQGGGIEIESLSTAPEVDRIVLANTLVRDNRAVRGGGLSVVGSMVSDFLFNLEVVLDGDSAVVANTADTDAGGIFCTNARILLRDASHVGSNTAVTGDGGGILGENCHIGIGSRGRDGGVLWSNAAPLGKGGGIRLVGERASATLYTIDPEVPARVVGNSARAGGAIATESSSTLELIDVVLEQNSALLAGAAIEMSGAGRLLMHGNPLHGPPGAVRCADAEACNLVRGNRILAEDGAAAGAVIATSPGNHAGIMSIHGTRFDFNEGGALARLGGAGTQVLFDGAVMVENRLGGALIDMASEARVLVLASNTIARNTLGANAPVLRGSGRCFGTTSGSLVRNSIVWQPGHALIDPHDEVDAACFHHLIGHAFDPLPPAPDRIATDPLFIDAEQGDFRVSSLSPAIDFAPAQSFEATRDRGPRVVDIEGLANVFGPQDAGAYERTTDRVFADGFDCDDC